MLPLRGGGKYLGEAYILGSLPNEMVEDSVGISDVYTPFRSLLEFFFWIYLVPR